jgi:hypothetical protein
MAYSASRIGKVQFAEQSSWGSFSSGSFSVLECEPPEFDFPTATEEVNSIRSALGAAPDYLKGAQTDGTLTLKFRLHGLHSNGAAASSNPSNTAESTLLKLAMGGQLTGGYVATGVATSSTTTTLKVDSGGDYSIGGGVMQPYSYGGFTLFEPVIPRSIATNDITLLWPVRTAAADNGTTHGTITNYVTNDQPTPISVVLTGQSAGYGFKLKDCAVSGLTIESTPQGFLSCTVTMTVGSWEHDTTTGALASYSYDSLPNLPVAVGYHGASFGSHIQGSTSAVGEIPCGSITWTMTNELTPITGFDGTQGTVQYALVNREIKVSGSISASDWVNTNLQTSTVASHNTDPTQYETLRMLIGDQPGNSMCIFIPRISLTKYAPEDQGGIQGISFEAIALDHSADTSVPSTPANSPFRIVHC